MVTFAEWALAWAGPTAALTATALITSAAARATRVRVNCDCDDIFVSLFADWFDCRPMNKTNQGACQSRKSAKNCGIAGKVAGIPNQELARFPNSRPGKSAARAPLATTERCRSFGHEREFGKGAAISVARRDQCYDQRQSGSWRAHVSLNGRHSQQLPTARIAARRPDADFIFRTAPRRWTCPRNRVRPCP